MNIIDAVKTAIRTGKQFAYNGNYRFEVANDGQGINRLDWITAADGSQYFYLSDDNYPLTVDEILRDDWDMV